MAITLILLALLSPLFKNRQIVYGMTTLLTVFVSVADMLNALPNSIRNLDVVQSILKFYSHYLPFFDSGMGWILPATIGLMIGWLISLVTRPKPKMIH